MENKIITDHLKVTFTDSEIQKKGLQLAQTMGEADQLEIDKRSVASDYKSRIDAKLAVINKLKEEVNNGYAYLPVKCEVRYNDPTPGQKTIIRQDTMAVVHVLDMSSDERQVKITDFLEVEQADAPVNNNDDGGDEHGIDKVNPPVTETSKKDRDVLNNTEEPVYQPLNAERYMEAEFVKEFHNATAALDAEKFAFPKGTIKKMADQSKVKILRKDSTGTVFTMGESEIIFFDVNEKADGLDSVQLINGRIGHLKEAIKQEPDSKMVKDWKNEIRRLRDRLKKFDQAIVDDTKTEPVKEDVLETEDLQSDKNVGKLIKELTTEDDSEDVGRQSRDGDFDNDNTYPDKITELADQEDKARKKGSKGLSGKPKVDSDEQPTKKRNKKDVNPDLEFSNARPASWFTDRIGKEIEVFHPDKDKFKGVMNIDDQTDAEYQSGVGQNGGGFSYRDIAPANVG